MLEKYLDGSEDSVNNFSGVKTIHHQSFTILSPVSTDKHTVIMVNNSH